MASHKLSILVEALGTGEANRKLQGIDKTVSSIGSTAGKGIRTSIGNLTKVAVVGAAAGFGALAAAVVQGTNALREDAVIAAQTNAVLKSTHGVAGMTAAAVAGLADKLSMLNGVDDNVVQSTENVLLTFTKIGKDVFPTATQATLDWAAATGKDSAGAAQALGKALQDPLKGMTGLRRMGVVLTDQQQAQIRAFMKAGDTARAQGVILDELAVKYGGVAKAQADADPSKRLGVAWERFTKVLATAVLPVVQDVQVALTDALSDPKVISGARDLGKYLGDAVKGLVSFGKSLPWGQMADGLRTAAGFAKGLVSAFTSMPPEVQATIIGLAGLNKLSGGAVGGIVSELGKGLVKGVLGINAGVVNVKGAVVAGGGGLAGTASSVGGGKASAIASAVGKVFVVGMAAGVAAELWSQFQQQSSDVNSLGQSVAASAAANAPQMSAKQLQDALDNLYKQAGADNKGNITNLVSAFALAVTNPFNHGLDNLSATEKSLRDQLAALSGRPVGEHAAQSQDVGPVSSQRPVGEHSGLSGSDTAARIVKPLDRLHQDFVNQLHVLKKSADPAAMAAAAARIAKQFASGIGGATDGKRILATLLKDRAAVKATGNTAMLARIDAAIARVRGALPRKEWIHQQLVKADEIAKSGASTKSKLDQLKAIENQLKAKGDAHAARQVAAIRGTTSAVKGQKLAVTTNVSTNVSVTAGGIRKTVSVRSRYGASVGSYGGTHAGGVRT